MLKDEQLTYKIRGCVYEVYRNLGSGFPVAVLNRNKPAFYCVPADVYESMLERLDDQSLAAIVRERRGEQSVRVDLREL